jgi:hypothetical protein
MFVETGGEKVEVDMNRVLEMLNDVENLKFELSLELILLVKENILFVDSINGTVKLQPMFDLLAVKNLDIMNFGG